MSAKLPYVTSASSIKNALERIRSAATPPRFTTDFVNTVLQIKGGTGAVITPFMKRIGFVASDGTPTELYKRFRNQVNGGAALAEGIKYGYAELGTANEYFYKLPDKDLQALILQVTGLDRENRVAQSILATLKTLKSFADFDVESDVHAISSSNGVAQESDQQSARPQFRDMLPETRGMGLNLAYTINLNLPATTDQAVFNAIFKSLREHLLSGNE